MFVRKLGKVLRGKATPSQIVLAALLGGALGFVPGFFLMSDLGGGFAQAPGLILALLFLVLILNANLALFGITLVLAKLVSVLLLPVSFAVGRFLLDGPTQGLFKAMINAPVLAWFGLEHYATTGGLVVGTLFGVGMGVLFLRAVRSFRARMANVEEGSERYKKLAAKRSVRFVSWVVLGKGKGKKTYRELLESRKKGLPIRIPGVVVVVVAVGLLLVAQSILTSPVLRNAMQSGLEQWNGATVDLEETRLDLTGGELLIAGLAMADPNDLIRDTFKARTLDVKLGGRDLLRKRLVIDTIASRAASTGTLRNAPGKRVVKPAPPPPPPPEPGSKTLEDYLKEAEEWKARLEQVARWLEHIAGSDEPAATDPEARDERIERAAEEYGLARVAASHLVEGAPMVLIRNLVFEDVTAAQLEGDLIDIRASNLSSNPRLVEQPLELKIAARSGLFSLTFRVDAAGSRTAAASFSYRGLPVDTIAAALKSSPIRGGTMDLSLSGTLDCSSPDGIRIDLPLQVHLQNTNLALPGMQETAVQSLTLPLGLKGPLAAPRITVDDGALADALVAAGKKELANQVRARADALLKGKVPGVGEQLGGLVEGDKSAEQLVDEAKKKAEEEARKRAEEELKKRLPGGLFGEKKKK